MTIHTVRNPFMCREGQFTPSKRDLCIGLDLNTLSKTDRFLCYIGKNKSVRYEIDSLKALEVGQEWKNPKGKTVLIVPLSLFTKIDEKEEKTKKLEEFKKQFDK